MKVKKEIIYQDETRIDKEIRINKDKDDSNCHPYYHQCQRMSGKQSCGSCGWIFLR